MVTSRIKNMRESATVQIDSMVKDLREQGKQIISLNVGEPDFQTPYNITQACINALNSGKTKYTSVSGIPALKQAICNKLRNENNVIYNPENIVVSTGAKQALYNAVHAIAEHGDNVIIPSPCWVSYTQIVRLAGAEPVTVRTKENYHLDLQAISEAITENTKAVIINNPCNPTGAVYTYEELKDLMSLAIEKNIIVISDEVYEKLVYENNSFVSVASVLKGAEKHCILINGFSKSYAMTGWRIGYMAAPAEIAKAAASLQSHETSCSTSFVQWAGVEALTGPQDSIEIMRKEFEKRKTYVTERLKGIKGIKLQNPEGAFYVFPDVSFYYGMKTKNGKTITDSLLFCQYILDETQVAVVPGEAFEDDRCIRISYSNSMDNLKEAMDRIRKALSMLSR